MRVAALGREVSAGVIVGLSAVIYALSYGALLFSGPLAPFVGYGITIALITAILGALFGWIVEERAFIAGPDSNTISVLATILAGMSTAGVQSPDVAIMTVLFTSVLAALVFYGVAWAQLSALVRYIPFSVMAGFLASTGWLMCSGALNIISATPLTLAGLDIFLADPRRPELLFGIAIAVLLFVCARRVSAALLIPVVMLIATIGLNLFLASGLCASSACSRGVWMFARLQDLEWRPPWALSWRMDDLMTVAALLPDMLVVNFVGLLTILLSVASLELNFHREFDLNKVLKSHAAGAAASAALGGFVGIISIGRTMLNKQAGGGAIAGTVAAALCLAMLLGAGQALSYVPKAALGGLVLFLGLGMLKQWVWDQRRTARPVEFAQILLIVAMVANFGFMVGFSVGLLISCLVFIVSYSRVPLADLATNLGVFTSAVVRPEADAAQLRQNGRNTLIYRLSGYVFFGSASKVEAVFQHLDDTVEGVIIDFSNVSGIDGSAVNVFQRMLRRYRQRAVHFYLVYGTENKASVQAVAQPLADRGQVSLFESLDRAVETAEDAVLATRRTEGATPLAFLESTDDRATFLRYCELLKVPAGHMLCAENDRSAEIFFIESGSLAVVKAADKPTPLRLAKLHKGAMVGELAFYTGEARTASIVADSDSLVYVLREAALARLRTEQPELGRRFDHMVIVKLSNALTRTNRLVAMYR